MTRDLIKKHIKLSFEFDNYVVKHPTVFRSIPSGAHIFITSSANKQLSEANLELAHNSRARNRFVAHKTGRTWNVKRLNK